MFKNKRTIAVFVASIFFVAFFATNVDAAQNSNYPSPSQCNGADWNIGLPDGTTCASSITTGGNGAMERDAKATSIFGAKSRLKPDLASLNKFCQEYTGDSTSYATYGRMHRYCNGCDQNISWYNGSSWTTTVACHGVLNVQQVRCSTSCGPICAPHTSKQCVGNAVYWYNSCGAKEDLFQSCSSNQICQNAQCVNVACSSNSACGTSGYIGSPFCQNGDVYKTYRTYTCNNQGTANSSCSQSDTAQLQTNCAANQACSNGQCVNLNIACSTNAQCGTSGYTGSPFCQGNAVYKNYKTYTCNNPGTANSSCSQSDAAQLQTNCASNQTCSNGQCQNLNIACSTNAGCGVSSFIGSPFCQGNSIYKYYKTYTCNNSGTANSSCSDSTVAQLISACPSNQTCSNGSCSNVNIACNANSDCGINGYIGSPFCQSGDVYKTYRTYTCNNQGTANSSCSQSDIAQLQTNCTASQTCSNGQCVNQNIACSSASDCGTSGYIGSPFCQNGDVYKTYRTFTCNNAGTANSSCSNSLDDRLITDCASNQICSNGSCGSSCTRHFSQRCSGNNLYWYDSCGVQQDLIQYCPNGCYNNYCGQQYNVTVQTNAATNISNNQVTLNGYLYAYNSNNINYVWFQWGISTNYGNETNHQAMYNSGSFSQNIANLYSGSIYHFRAVAQTNNGNIVYGQDMTFYPSGYYGSYLTVNKTARNMTSGNSSWSTTVYANPSDVLMFMITIQATGNQAVSNVFVRDIFPSNLIYKDQLVISGASNYYNNYFGNITSGINLGAISTGQTVTITYQAQLASAQNFNYGTTTLNNNVTVSSSSNNYNPSSNASIVVTRSSVYGATTISTGLGDNFLTDSLLFPLVIALIGIWMFKLGAFFRIEKWLTGNKSKYRDYKAQKELKLAIARIQKSETRN